MGGKRSLRWSTSGVAGKDASTSTSTSTKRRRKTLDEGNKEILPDDCWEKILESVDNFSVIAFASVCMQLRCVQKRSRRELKKRIPDDLRTCNAAARGGHLGILRYLRKHGPRYWNARYCPWDASTCSSAALGGHLKVLKYLHENGCPWDENTCNEAAVGGHLEVLKYAHEKGCPWTEWTCHKAARGGHLEVLKYARDNGCPEY